MAEETTIELKRAALNHYFQNLNTPQQQAVFHVNGPVLVLAGAGSGKTTAMIHRIVQMIHFGDGWVQANASITKEDAAYLKDYIADKQPADLERLCSILAVQPIQPWHILAITFTNKAANELKPLTASNWRRMCINVACFYISFCMCENPAEKHFQTGV